MPSISYKVSKPCHYMEKHVANAQIVAEFLKENEAVEWVNYPGLSSHPDYHLAKSLIPKGPGAMLSFGLGVAETRA